MSRKTIFLTLTGVLSAALLMGAAVDTSGSAITDATDLGDIDMDATTVGDFKDYISPDNRIWYATCPTAAGTGNAASTPKVATIVPATDDFELTNGVRVAVKFSNNCTLSTVYLNVNSTGGKRVYRYGTTGPTTYMWYANQVVDFVYDGAYWQIITPPPASTTYEGVVKLINNTNSTSATTAVVPAALRTVRQYVDTKVDSATVTNLVWDIYLTSQRYIYDAATETCYRFSATNDFLYLSAVTNVPPTAAVIEELEK